MWYLEHGMSEPGSRYGNRVGLPLKGPLHIQGQIEGLRKQGIAPSMGLEIDVLVERVLSQKRGYGDVVLKRIGLNGSI